jgi:hypothetical protein
MKAIKLTIFVFIIIFIFGKCASPLDVPANRVITTENSKKDDGSLLINLNTTDISFGLVPYQVTAAKDFIIMNATNKPLTINSMNFKLNPDKFSIYSPKIPFTLAPKDSLGWSQRVVISFSAQYLGEFSDTLIINDYSNPAIKIYAVVPSVEVSDVDFGSVKVGSSMSKPITIINHTYDTITVTKEFIETDPEAVFSFLSALPIKVGPKSSEIRIIQFRPMSEKPYKGLLEFNILTSGYVDKIAELTGTGIK